MPREEDRPVQQSVLDRLIDDDPEKLHEIPPTRAQSVRALKAEGTLPGRVRLRHCRYLNNVVQQDHRVEKTRVWLPASCGG